MPIKSAAIAVKEIPRKNESSTLNAIKTNNMKARITKMRTRLQNIQGVASFFGLFCCFRFNN